MDREFHAKSAVLLQHSSDMKWRPSLTWLNNSSGGILQKTVTACHDLCPCSWNELHPAFGHGDRDSAELKVVSWHSREVSSPRRVTRELSKHGSSLPPLKRPSWIIVWGARRRELHISSLLHFKTDCTLVNTLAYKAEHLFFEFSLYFVMVLYKSSKALLAGH